MGISRPQVQISFVDPDPIDTDQPVVALRMRWLAGALLLVAAVLLAYAPVLWGQFIYLDEQTVAQNLAIRSWRQGLWAIWMHPTIIPHYQPLTYTAYLLEFKLFSIRLPGGYLMVNALLHALNAVLLWTLLKKLDLPGALAGAALFALHPVNVDAVAWISQQSMLLCGVFYLLAMLVYLRYCGINPSPPTEGWLRLPQSQRVLYALSMGLFLAAIASHPAGVTLPAAALIIIWWERARISKSEWIRLLPFMLIGVLWIAVTWHADRGRAAAMNTPLDTDLLVRVLAAGRAMWVYALHLVLPMGLGFAYPKWPMQTPWLEALWLVAIGMLLVSAWLIRPRFGRGPLAVVLLVIAGLLPAFIFRTDLDTISYVQDHLAYLPGMVLIAGVAAVVTQHVRVRGKWLKPALAVLPAAAMGVLTILRLPDYRTPSSLWAAVLRGDPSSVLAHNNLGMAELEHENLVQAMAHFRAALERNPNDLHTLLNIAQTYLAQGDVDRAVVRYREAVLQAPDDPVTHFGLAKALEQRGKSAEAIAEYQIVLKQRPDHLVAHNNIGLLHASRGQADEAFKSYERAIAINPSFIPPYINSANLLFMQGRIDAAEKMLDRVVKIDPSSFEAFMSAGAMVGSLAQGAAENAPDRAILLARAERFFRQAVYLQPRSVEAHLQLGRTLFLQDRFDDAAYHFSRATQLDPANTQAQRNLQIALERSQEKGK